MRDDIILKVCNVSKAFGPIHALKSVNFELRRGEIHALAGENGAGKSTLMNIVDGILQPDSGEILWEGQPVEITSPAKAHGLGIGLVHQECALCPDVSVAENVFMAAINTSRSWLIDSRQLETRAGEVLSQLGNIDPSALVGSLSVSQQQLVEIAKALTLDCRVLILDEPTAALTEREAQILFGIMRNLAGQGIGIIYISHRMAEIFDNCDRVTVFRDGRHIVTMDVTEAAPSEVVNAMVGRPIDRLYPEKAAAAQISDEPVLEVRDLTEATRFRDISLKLRRGEILGIAGLIGSGRSEIVRGICALEGQVQGEIRLNGEPLNLRHYQDCIAAGIVYLSEDRKGDGVFLTMPIAANISALDVDQCASRFGIIDAARESRMAATLGGRLNLKYGRLSDPVSSLSGGNQQKVALARMLAVKPKVIFLDEPTRGVDVGAKSEIYRILRNLAEEGVGIVVISSELPELIGISDRIIVIREGRLAGEIAGQGMTEETIMHLASGVSLRNGNGNEALRDAG
jgi:ribose transport system ATP-binding protein